MADFGTDVSGYPDYDPLALLVNAYVGLCQRVCRRLTNDRGSWGWAPDECTNILNYLNETLTNDRVSLMEGDIERETEREEGVVNATASVTVSTPVSTLGQSVIIHIVGNTSDGPFTFVLAASKVTLTILQAG